MHPHWHLASAGPVELQTEKARTAANSGADASEVDGCVPVMVTSNAVIVPWFRKHAPPDENMMVPIWH
jgi:hypothetical protein